MALMLVMPFLAAGAILRSYPRTAPYRPVSNMYFLLAAEAGARSHRFEAQLQGGASLVVVAVALVTGFRRLST